MGEDIHQDGRVDRALVRAATTQVRRLEKSAKEVPTEDPEAVHQARVATRRLRTLVRLARPWLRKKVFRKLNKPLQKIGRSLGVIRDNDVQRALAAQLGLPGSAAKQRNWSNERPKRLRKAARSLHEVRWRNWLKEFDSAVSAIDAKLVVALPTWVRSLVEEAEVALQDEPDDARLHRLRIVAKRLRYTLEFFGANLLPEHEVTVMKLTAIQDSIGAWRDLNCVRQDAGLDARPLALVAAQVADQWQVVLERLKAHRSSDSGHARRSGTGGRASNK